MVKQISDKIQLLIPMSGKGSRFIAAGYKQRKPLIPINGTPIIKRMLEFYPAKWPATFVLSSADSESGLEELLAHERPGANIIYIEPHTLGPGAAIERALPQLNAESPVLVSYCDFGMVWSASDFERFVRESNCDACVISYRGFHAHYLSPTTYAYSRMDGDRVVEVKEKGSFTDNRENEFASGGAYYFKSARLLGEALAKQKELGLAFNGEFYTSLTIEALLRMDKNADVRIFEIDNFYQWGTPDDLKDFEYWEATFRSKLRFETAPRAPVAQILMPMAGQGTRFKENFSNPKPFLEWGGRTMFRRALESLPPAPKNVFVVLKAHQEFMERDGASTDSLVCLQNTPAGQALSVEAALSNLDKAGDIIVSACDHAIVLNPKVWSDFKALTTVDAAIFTVRGFPGARRSPRAFAYVEVESADDQFSAVKNVSVKKTISAAPECDPLLVGTFWFRDRKVLRDGIIALKEKGATVNGELYLDSIFNELIAAERDVRIVPLEGYIGWGDPDSFAEALYWERAFGPGHSRPSEIRGRFSGVRE